MGYARTVPTCRSPRMTNATATAEPPAVRAAQLGFEKRGNLAPRVQIRVFMSRSANGVALDTDSAVAAFGVWAAPDSVGGHPPIEPVGLIKVLIM
jgi:hypothetical protein